MKPIRKTSLLDTEMLQERETVARKEVTGLALLAFSLVYA